MGSSNEHSQQQQQQHERTTHQQQQSYQQRATPTGLRILCLHDAHSSASSLQHALKKLGDRLYQNHGIDLVYINSPLCVSAEAGDTDRVWYETTTTTSRNEATNKKKNPVSSSHNDTGDDPHHDTTIQDNNNSRQQQQQQQQQQDDKLIGLDASLCLLQQVWASLPFWGILGIGQGAAVGSLLSLLPNLKPRAKFGIFINGHSLIQEAERLVEADEDHWACLHLCCNDDAPPKSSGGGGGGGGTEKLVQQFGGTVELLNSSTMENGSYSKKVLNKIGKFIIEQKKKITRQDGECRALALQNQLYVAEQEASRLIAQRIAENPPSVLMAVVAPKAVATCVGGIKRRGPQEEGGGAPCPPEFLLRRETRSKHDEDGSSSRVHPEEQRK